MNTGIYAIWVVLYGIASVVYGAEWFIKKQDMVGWDEKF